VMLEGNLDVILSHQSGVCQAVATCGTALGKKQLTTLCRYTQKLILAFDADMAGVKATKRAAELAWEEDLDVKVIPIKTGQDVADIVKEDPQKWAKMVEKKKSLAGYFFNLGFKNRVLSLDQKKTLADKLLKLFASIPSRVEQSHYLKRLAEEVQVPEEYFWEKIKQNQRKNHQYTKTQPAPEKTSGKKSRSILLEERLIGLIFNYPKLFFKYRERFNRTAFESEVVKRIYQDIKKILDKMSPDLVKSQDINFESRELQLKVAEIALEVEKDLGPDPDENREKAEQELKICFAALEKEFLKNQRFQLLKEIKMASINGDKNQMESLMERLQTVSKEIAR